MARSRLRCRIFVPRKFFQQRASWPFFWDAALTRIFISCVVLSVQAIVFYKNAWLFAFYGGGPFIGPHVPSTFFISSQRSFFFKSRLRSSSRGAMRVENATCAKCSKRAIEEHYYIISIVLRSP
ncbi:hypothetical protein QR680_012790 [Steinernema hermaphroditum]|uniref:Transmembrane protein n=1 Tax=Steinernema hermaphroditum TaxID=289476 RepID=A0AA39M153_9BILA|nr:hypothetical protein QR680_012790 [Steinernema hermaphroditum]